MAEVTEEGVLGHLRPDHNRTRKKGRKLHQVLATGVVGLGALQVGVTLGWTSPELPYLMSDESFIIVNTVQGSWISSLLPIGAVIGAIPAGKIADKIGRRLSIQIYGVPFLVSWLLVVFGTHVETLYIARLCAGTGAGGICVLALIYIGEIAEPSIRGILASSFGILMACGSLCSYIAGAYLTYIMHAAIAALLTIIFLVLSLMIIIETPVWLVQQGRIADAEKSLAILRGSEYDLVAELALLQAHAVRRKSQKEGFVDLFRTQIGRRAMIISFGLTCFQQLSGIDALLCYTIIIFKSAGSTIDPYLSAIIIGIVETSMEIVAGIAVDMAGRRPLLILSGSGMLLCNVTLGYYFRLKNFGANVTDIGWLPLSSLILFTVSYSLGFGSIPWVMNSELFPPQIKGVAGSIAVVLNWSMGASVLKCFPILVSLFGETSVFWGFGGFMIFGVIFVILIVPETKGKTLQQIQSILSGRKDVIPHQNIAAEGQQGDH